MVRVRFRARLRATSELRYVVRARVRVMVSHVRLRAANECSCDRNPLLLPTTQLNRLWLGPGKVRQRNLHSLGSCVEQDATIQGSA